MEERGVNSSWFIVVLIKDRFKDAGKQEEGRAFQSLQFIGRNDELWDSVRELDKDLKRVSTRRVSGKRFL